MSPTSPTRIAFVPEHFSVPLRYAVSHFALDATLHPYPSGTGAMITALRNNEVDVAVGLTEGFIAGLGKPDTPADGGYRLVGTYVTTPLCWAALSGSQTSSTITELGDLKGTKIGVSRLGSGSHVMGHVLADQQGWLPSTPYADTVILDNFDGLKKGVNAGTADFFLWETFTSAKSVKGGEIKRVGEISTPWGSWLVVAGTKYLGQTGGEGSVEGMWEKIDKGVEMFEEQRKDTEGGGRKILVSYICKEMGYLEVDVEGWLPTVEFSKGTKGVSVGVVENCMAVLRKAGVLMEGVGMAGSDMVAVKR